MAIEGKMPVRINGELCTGCGTCVDACTLKAIRLVAQRAEIVPALCTQCGACLDACPNGAIINELTATPELLIAPQADIKPDLQADQRAIVLQETKESKHGIKTLAGAALAFLGSEVAPRIVDVVINSIEQRLTQSTATTIPSSPSSSRNYEIQSKGQCKQMRYRGGNKANRISRGRR